MTDRFDEIIQGSRPEMPDPAEYRRLNRVPLRKPVRRFPVLPKPGPSFVVATTCFALLVLFSGQISQLGSDDFETNPTQELDALGNEATIHTDEVRGSTLVFHGSDEDAKELLQQKAAGEGILSYVSCIGYGGQTRWMFVYMHEINGVMHRTNTRYNPEGYPNVDLPNEEYFQRTYRRDLNNLYRNTPPLEEYFLEIEGTRILMKTWKKWYPGFGEVTYSRGTPLD